MLNKSDLFVPSSHKIKPTKIIMLSHFIIYVKIIFKRLLSYLYLILKSVEFRNKLLVHIVKLFRIIYCVLDLFCKMKNLLHIYLIEINEYEIEILGFDTHYYEFNQNNNSIALIMYQRINSYSKSYFMKYLNIVIKYQRINRCIVCMDK